MHNQINFPIFVVERFPQTLSRFLYFKMSLDVELKGDDLSLMETGRERSETNFRNSTNRVALLFSLLPSGLPVPSTSIVYVTSGTERTQHRMRSYGS